MYIIELSEPLARDVKPFSLFPWVEQLGPRSSAEELLRRDIGLRDLKPLEGHLKAGAEAGLDKRNSRIFFEALELRDLLQAEGAGSRRSERSTASDGIAAPSSSAREAAAKFRTVDQRGGLRRARSTARRTRCGSRRT